MVRMCYCLSMPHWLYVILETGVGAVLALYLISCLVIIGAALYEKVGQHYERRAMQRYLTRRYLRG